MFQHTTILLRPGALIRMEGDNMSALSTTGHNDGITLHCLQSIAQLIPLSSAVFYRVNAYLKPEAYVLHNISNSTHQQYLEHFQPLDPLSPSRFGQQVVTVATMTPGICARHRHYYHEFMLPNHVCDMIEIFIRRGHRIIAGISLMRDIPFPAKSVCEPRQYNHYWDWQFMILFRKTTI